MKATATAVLCAAFATAAYAGNTPNTPRATSATNTADAAQEARKLSAVNITLAEAIRTAEQQIDGHAISATFDTTHGDEGRYEVLVLSPDGRRLTRFDLDAYNGAVAAEWNHSLSLVYPELSPRSVQDTRTTLANAIATAEQQAGGKAIDAALGGTGGQMMYSVDVARPDGSTQKLEVDGSDGRIAAAAG